MSNLLENRGIAIIGEAIQKEKPVVVIGTARGGTSMVAGALAKLGVFMGDLAEPPVYEDLRLAAAIEQGKISLAAEIIEAYSLEHRHWGWKRPSAIDSLDLLNDLFGSPVYIFVFKDILSIAQRNSISMLEEVLIGMETALRDYGRVVHYLRRNNSTSMLVSYDKSLWYPEYFVEMLVQFCKLTPSSTQIKEAVDFIKPAPMDYLDASRITKAQGCIDMVKHGVVYGWARYIHLETPAVVSFYIGDEKIGEAVADGWRDDLDLHFRMSCAFAFHLPENKRGSAGVLLRARVVNEIRDLDNSPFVVR
jgi:hypothetical protein